MDDPMDVSGALLFRNREEAGKLLAKKVKELHLKDALVLAIPRGGVVVGREIANAIKAELDIVTPRKLRDQYEPELAIGAVMPNGSMFLSDEVMAARQVQRHYLEEEKKRQVAEASRRLEAYRGERPYPRVKGRAIVLVDDGVATGATMVVAERWVKKQGAARVIIATPVIAEDVLRVLRQEADEIVYLAIPSVFYGIGQFYQEFEQVEDSEVVSILKSYWQRTL